MIRSAIQIGRFLPPHLGDPDWGGSPAVSDDGNSHGDSQRIQALMGNFPGIIYRCSNEPGWPMEFIDGQCEAITGYTAGAIESGEISWGKDIIHPDERADLIERVQTAVESGEPFEVTYRILTANGNIRWLWEQGQAIATPGDETRLEGIIMDVTERRERKVQLQKIDRMLRHNLRNDMNVVLAMAEDIRTRTDAGVQESATQIIETIESLLAKVEKEREILRLLGDQPAPGAVQLMSAFHHLANSLQAEYPAATIQIEGPDEVAIRGSEQLSVALRELLENALEHNDTDAPMVTVTVEEDGDIVTAAITDDGPGIPEMEVNLLTGRAEETPLSHGQGLGLWLVQLIVRRSGGAIQFGDDDTAGSTVTLTLERDQE